VVKREGGRGSGRKKGGEGGREGEVQLEIMGGRKEGNTSG
jgi:hypothetical protein